MIWYHTSVSTSRLSCFTITTKDPKIWYHTRVSISRRADSQPEQTVCFTITANNLLSHKSQHEQTVLLNHYSQISGIEQGSCFTITICTQESVRADSLASPLQPMIWYHTRVSTSRQSCFTITANDLVSHKGPHEQTVLLHHYNQ